MNINRYGAIVVGVSAGGMDALSRLFCLISNDFGLPIVVVQHLHASSNGYLAEFLGNKTPLYVKEVEEKFKIQPGTIYLCPSNYHLLIEADETFALSIDEKVNHTRPSIDVLFESAARVWSQRLIGIILTGANRDGAEGIRRIKACGGLTIAQDPATAESPFMPQAAIDTGCVDKVLSLEGIRDFLNSLTIETRGCDR
jgi:two-component system, chemotaxis family, protein-glutamate methylesterase/glutaminase